MRADSPLTGGMRIKPAAFLKTLSPRRGSLRPKVIKEKKTNNRDREEKSKHNKNKISLLLTNSKYQYHRI